MRSIAILTVVALLTFATPASSVTGTGQVTVLTGAEVTVTLAANTIFVLVGWVPVVTSVTNPVGNIYAYVNGFGFPFAAITGATQDADAVVGQFTVDATSGGLELVPAFQRNADFVLTNNGATTRQIILGCQANQVGGACLFNIRTVPTADPAF
jgi:hypothetical protein